MAKRKFKYDNGSGGVVEIKYDTANQGTFGGYKSAEKDSEFMYAVVDRDTLDEIRDELQSIKKRIETQKYQDSVHIANLNEKHNTDMDKLRCTYEDKIDKIKDDANETFVELRDNYNQQVSLNYNLKKAVKERANRKRKMDKHGPAYKPLSVSSFSYKVTYKVGKKTMIDYWELYKITLQTYFESTVPMDTVDNEILNDINDQELRLSNVNPKYWRDRKIALDDLLIDLINADSNHLNEEDYIPWKEKNLILRRDYRNDFQKGYWEVTLTTTFPYERVDEYNDEDVDISEEVI